MPMQYTSPLPLLLAGIAFCTQAFAGGPVASIANSANASIVDPAVSGPNGKIEGIYGAINSNYLRGGAASFSLPMGQHYGAQIDASYLRAFEADIYGAGGHFFTRNPAKGLFGLATGFQHSTDFTDVLVGFEGELYLRRLTLGAFVGYNHADLHVIPGLIPNLATQIDFVAVRLFATAYLTENLALTAEYQNRFERNFYLARLEYLTPIKGMAVFVEGGLGYNDHKYIMGGLRFYLGGSGSLIHRHRNDDPANINSVFTGTHGAALSNTRPTSGAGGPPPPPPPPPP
ncbi:MAG: hypothetical protein IPK32_23760 [Verrucomicrobiaceae bacterium]|nr:hypothetical protein [Verrucomicrobiaceae bacterium]